MTNAVVVPYLFRSYAHFDQILSHYKSLIGRLDPSFRILIVINSIIEPPPVPPVASGREKIEVLYMTENDKSEGNQKLDAIFLVLKYLQSEFPRKPFNTLLFDDDARPSIEVLQATAESLKANTCSFRLVSFETHDIFNLVDLSGCYVVNQILKRPQIWGNIAFRDCHTIPVGGLSSEHLYDEQYLIDSICKEPAKAPKFSTAPSLTISGTRTIGTFLTQRLRYCFENVSFSRRFLFDLAFSPILIFFWLAIGLNAILFVIGFLSLVLIGIAFFYRVNLPTIARGPAITPIFAPLWYFPYPLLAWPVFALYLTIGLKFGKNWIKRP